MRPEQEPTDVWMGPFFFSFHPHLVVVVVVLRVVVVVFHVVAVAAVVVVVVEMLQSHR